MIELPWPPASLAGHNKGHWHSRSGVIAKHRQWARLATKAAGIKVGATGDILVSATFYPPHRRGDRLNYPTRLKPYWDGIADALGVNDARFLPAFHYAEPCKEPRVVITIREP